MPALRYLAPPRSIELRSVLDSLADLRLAQELGVDIRFNRARCNDIGRDVQRAKVLSKAQSKCCRAALVMLYDGTMGEGAAWRDASERMLMMLPLGRIL